MTKAIWILLWCTAIVAMGAVKMACGIVGSCCNAVDRKINDVFDKWI